MYLSCVGVFVFVRATAETASEENAPHPHCTRKQFVCESERDKKRGVCFQHRHICI